MPPDLETRVAALEGAVSGLARLVQRQAAVGVDLCDRIAANRTATKKGVADLQALMRRLIELAEADRDNGEEWRR